MVCAWSWALSLSAAGFFLVPSVLPAQISAESMRPMPPRWLDAGPDTVFRSGVFSLTPVMCPAFTALLGEQDSKPKTTIQLMVAPDQTSAMLLIDPIRVKAKGVAVHDVVGAVELSEPPPLAEPVLLLQLHVIDTLERPIDQRQLILVFEDSSFVDFGSMGAFRLHDSRDHKVEQNLTTRLPAMEFRRITRSTRVEVHLGDATFALTRQQLDGLRALYAAAICGGQPRS